MAIIVQAFVSDGEGQKMLTDTYLGFPSNQLSVSSVCMDDGGVVGEVSTGMSPLLFEVYSETPNYRTRTLIRDPHGNVHECANSFYSIIRALNESHDTGNTITADLGE